MSEQPRVIVVGLGPGGADHVTDETRHLLDGSRPTFLRTLRHPTATLARSPTSFDEVYDAAEDLDDVYRSIAEQLVIAAVAEGEVVYAVPGSPLVLERSVQYLRRRDDIEIDLRPAVSFLDLCWARLGIDPVEESVRLVDGHVFADAAAGERGPLLVAHTHATWVLSDLKLAVDAGPEQTAVVLQGLGTEDEAMFEVSWPELDRSFEPDHLTSLYLPTVAAPVGQELVRSVELMKRLRAECPWDAEQDHASLRRHLLEETHEVLTVLDQFAAATDDGEPADALYADLEEELGDLWFQILFHAELAQEAGRFTIADVAAGLHDKLVARHPHVFGTEGEADAVGPTALGQSALEQQWEQLKAAEKQRDSVLDGIPPGLPALALADKFLSKARRAGRPLGDATAEEWAADLMSLVGSSESAGNIDDQRVVEARLGRGLIGVVAAARRLGVDPESALRAALGEATRSFRASEGEGETVGRQWFTDWVGG